MLAAQGIFHFQIPCAAVYAVHRRRSADLAFLAARPVHDRVPGDDERRSNARNWPHRGERNLSMSGDRSHKERVGADGCSR